MMPHPLPEATRPDLSGTRSEPMALTQTLESMCRLAGALFNVPWVLVFLRQEFGPSLASDGAEAAWADGIPPEMQTILLRAQDQVVIEDISADPAFPAGRAPVGFVLAAPLLSAQDGQMGTFCLMGPAPRHFPESERAHLLDMIRIIEAHLCVDINLRRKSGQGELYRLLAENTTDTIVRGSLDGTRLYISPSVRNLLGYEPEELIGRKAIEIVHPDDAETFAGVMADLRACRVELAVSEQRQRHRNGGWVWLEAFIKLTRDENGVPDGYVASVRNVSRRKQEESRLSHIATHDALTGLPNRILMHERLEAQAARALHLGTGFALFCLDLDHFKPVNDVLGHEAGDHVLRTISARFRAVIRAEDTIARVGGDEFVVIQSCAGDTRVSAERLAERLVRAASAPLDHLGVPIQVGVSIGIAVAPATGFDLDVLLREADKALYEAKQAGKGQYRFYE